MTLGEDLQEYLEGKTFYLMPNRARLRKCPLESDMYLQGLPRLHVEVSTTTVADNYTLY